jgi:hypothetical protein
MPKHEIEQNDLIRQMREEAIHYFQPFVISYTLRRSALVHFEIAFGSARITTKVRKYSL